MLDAPPIVSWLHVMVVGHGIHGVYGSEGGTYGAGYTGYGTNIGYPPGRASSSLTLRSSSSMRDFMDFGIALSMRQMQPRSVEQSRCVCMLGFDFVDVMANLGALEGSGSVSI